MSDDALLSESAFRVGVLGSLAAGIGLFSYKNFFARRSYMVQFKAMVFTKDELGQSIVDDNLVYESTIVFQDRPIFTKSHEDIVHHVLDYVCKNERFQNVDPNTIVIDISRIHVI